MRYDVAVVDPVKGAVKINASPRRKVALYRTLLGQCLYNNEQFYSRTDRYTLEPLRTQGAGALLCSEVAEIERIRLVSIEYL